MSRPAPTDFELDMAMCGLGIGDPIPPQVKSRPDPGAYGGVYDEKPAAHAPAREPLHTTEHAPSPVEHRTSEAKPASNRGGYSTRASTARSTTVEE